MVIFALNSKNICKFLIPNTKIPLDFGREPPQFPNFFGLGGSSFSKIRFLIKTSVIVLFAPKLIRSVWHQICVAIRGHPYKTSIFPGVGGLEIRTPIVIFNSNQTHWPGVLYGWSLIEITYDTHPLLDNLENHRHVHLPP